MRRAGLVLAIWLAALATTAKGEGRPGDFDFYVLALSWSPSWCATAEDAAESPQCDAGAGHGFVLHGLWPQFEQGYPEFCDAAEPPSCELVDALLDIMPDRGLVAHQWRKHGSCSGLDPQAYFATARAAFEHIKIPARFDGPASDERLSAADIEMAFAGANPGILADGIAVICNDGLFEEVRICLTRDLAFRPCEEVDTRGCRQSGLRMPMLD